MPRAHQAAAQRAADTRDADGDGIYCESLPCPCSTGGGGGGGNPTPSLGAKLRPFCDGTRFRYVFF